jgi:hypothetical protein
VFLFFTGIEELNFCSVMFLNSGRIREESLRSYKPLWGVSGEGSLLILSFRGVKTSFFGVSELTGYLDEISFRATMDDSDSLSKDFLRTLKTFNFSGVDLSLSRVASISGLFYMVFVGARVTGCEVL